ncbi:MAG: zinc ribbon domain-containing protein [Propionibacteriaceae bacterium]|nr:zinc ribbon domain-containing protein [Propionibacteriaceae bacterium]
MPTYEYRCTECDHDFEVFQKFSDPALTKCPVCQGRLRKVFSPVGIVFKGSGFYSTDSHHSTASLTAAPGKAASPHSDAEHAKPAQATDAASAAPADKPAAEAHPTASA